MEHHIHKLSHAQLSFGRLLLAVLKWPHKCEQNSLLMSFSNYFQKVGKIISFPRCRNGKLG